MMEAQEFIAVPPSDDPDFIRVDFTKQELCGAYYPDQHDIDLVGREAYGLTPFSQTARSVSAILVLVAQRQSRPNQTRHRGVLGRVPSLHG